mmetsp:Transcript_10524/g.32204  ORF Transcript_10524/g.32204 Transcript_10524/m.32204 type:complete len:340 (-) Transcript_10524:2068-3087(-)
MKRTMSVHFGAVVLGAALVSVAFAGALVSESGRGGAEHGARALAERIINGTLIAEAERASHVVVLYDSYGQLCCGSLIDDDVVLSAAHCMVLTSDPAYIKELQVCAQSANLTSSRGTCVGVEQVFVHPRFNESNIALGNDVAIIKITRPIGGHAGSLRVLFERPPEGTKVVAMGYGVESYPTYNVTTEEDGARGLLRKGSFVVMSPKFCQFYINGENPLPNNDLLCVTGDNDGSQTAACHGDSGGPVMLQHQGRDAVLIGLISFSKVVREREGMYFSYGCAFRDSQQVFLSLHAAAVKRFIKRTMKTVKPTWSNYCDSFPRRKKEAIQQSKRLQKKKQD